MLFRYGLFLLLASVSVSASAVVVPVNAVDSYLNIFGEGGPTVVALDSVGGSGVATQISVTTLGEYARAGVETPENETLTNELIAVFSATDAFEALGTPLRVVDAIDAGIDIVTDADIDQDFKIVDGIIDVPDGANFLFVAPFDGFVADNHDTNGNLAIEVAAVPIPAGIVLLATGISLLGIGRFRARAS